MTMPERIEHTIDGVAFELEHDGALIIHLSPVGKEKFGSMVEVAAEHAAALLIFFRLPHVSALIEAASTARYHAAYLEDERIANLPPHELCQYLDKD